MTRKLIARGLICGLFAVSTACGETAGGSSSGGSGSGGTAGSAPSAGSSGNGGNAGTGGSAGSGGRSPDCAPLQSPQPGCEDCLAEQCQSQLSACANSLCLCKPFMGYTGQMNCLLACLPVVGATPQQADFCARNCGFQSLMYADKTTRELFDCLANPPLGPSRCPQCLGE